MRNARPIRSPDHRFSLPLTLLAVLLGLLWLAGGASRGDATGQVIVRAGAWMVIAVAIFAGPRPALGGIRPVLILLVATIALPIIQLIPLPPAWWQALPGRDILLLPGEPPSFRPWTMTPAATRNALASLVVPAATLLLLAQADETARGWLPSILLAMIGSAVLLGLLQFSGARFDNPLLNDVPGQVSSIFANRNHFALLLAIGCLLAPVWAFSTRDAPGWRAPVAGGLILLFVLTILATGSRSGMLLGAIALVIAPILIGHHLRRRLKHAPAWVLPAVLCLGLITIGGFVWLSFAADRAESIDRLIHLETNEDMRARALPSVLTMIRAYFPFGSGFGGFDPVFRIHEPLALLKFTYFNQAHNDFLGIALDGGLLALAVLGAAIGWWLIATVRMWRMPASKTITFARLGSATLFLILVASATDYPARTPIIMALATIAAVWLARGSAAKPHAALPTGVRDL
ncbi:O-antigen ligase family protein [Sphingomonas sp. BT-65]|uniref:O-antigen ligase family protein n=1 Tax=Sphingomonas sp. BT-65 TaxID=2989821 RepID=UPI0022356C8F|nr:O-antigen ligase family protein [Sphingomonas sp. BT-65]MCW4463471.1 O-antigen ligase family protein [Sphingomonas sp. BT-65]